MKRISIVIAALLAWPLLAGAAGGADDSGRKEVPARLKLYGFIRNYAAFDTRESKAGTKDLFYYLPKDVDFNSEGEDRNARNSFRMLAITSRLGVDVTGYHIGRTDVSAKIETDFYCMNGNVAVLRLRQAYALLSWKELGRRGGQSVSLKIGQAWHPMAAEQPFILGLETGTPFNPFSRTPQAIADYNFAGCLTLTGGLIYQMQYLSTGPNGVSDNYLKYSCIPEGFLSLALKKGGFLVKAGADVLSIKPRWENSKGIRVADRLTTVIPFVYAQYTKGAFTINGRTLYGSAGEHINILSGYGVAATSDVENDGKYEYVPLHSTVSFISAKYGKKFQVMGMVGYMQNLGTSKALYSDVQDWYGTEYTSPKCLYISSNTFSNLNKLIRISPAVAYNLGKLTFAIEYNATIAQYGRSKTYSDDNIQLVNSKNGLADTGLHWVTGNRILTMVKFTF